MVEPKTGADHGISAGPGRPGEGEAWVEITIVALSKAGAHTTKTLRSAGCEIERIRASLHFMKNIEEAVARAQIHGEVRTQFEFVLDVTEILGFAQAVDGQRSVQAGRADLVGVEGAGGGKYDCACFCVALIQLDAPNLHPGFQCVPSLNPGQVIDFRERIAYAGAHLVVV